MLAVTQSELPRFLEALLERGFEIDVPVSIREFQDDGITVVRFSEVMVDLIRPLIPAFSRVLERAVDSTILGRRVRVVSPEGLIVTKLIAFRPQDEADIRDLIAVGGVQLDLNYIRDELAGFAPLGDSRRTKFEECVRIANLQPPNVSP